MSTTGIFELTAITTGSIQSDDVLVMVDVHDTAQAAQGSTRKTTLANLYQAQTTAVTVSTPLPNIAQTWNNAGVTFTAVLLNVTSTASAAGSLLLDLQVAGVSQFKVTKAGAVTAIGAVATGALGVTGAATFSSTVATGALTVTGAATVSTTLSVGGGKASIDGPTGYASLGNTGIQTDTALSLPAGTTAASSLRIAHGAAPTAPVNGDMWSTTAGMFCRINGVTKSFTLV